MLVDGSYSDWARLDNLAREAAMSSVALQPVLINMPLEVYTPRGGRRAHPLRRVRHRGRPSLPGPDGSFWARCGCPRLLPATV